MELKYRAVDQRPSEYIPHSPGVSYFPQQAIRAGFMSSADMRYAPDLGLNPTINMEANQRRERNGSLGALDNDMGYPPNRKLNVEVDLMLEQNNSVQAIQYDAMQRQLEKQRIREEIIASEFERRRMLELEVRRELEQEMAMQRAADGFSFQERSAMWFDERFSFVDRVDDQLMREPWASWGRDMFSSRYPMRLIPGATRATVDMFPSRYPVQPFPGATQSETDAEVRRSRIIMLAKPTPNLSGVKRKLTTPPGESSWVPPIRNEKVKEEHSCALCQVSATSAKGLNEHLQGKKHKMMEEKLRAEKIDRKKAPNGKFFKGKSPAKSTKNTKEEMDEKSMPQPLEDLKDNSNGASSSKDDRPKLAPEVDIRPESRKKRKKSFKFWCEQCGVGAYCEKVFETHMNGKKHWLHLPMNKPAASDTAENGCNA
ncbi:uncharacterized protein LOC116196323 isoform X2 [Punica granatum]|uniref:Uncharacterized protein LOC116196323 isoform X2 n=1 Tax=Punica granatum TaxID=22663 RepID=A0A6P8CFL0_PUNGR|nr:uncharacterized protein LOC116196323 isoform X2 [Punica granatum]